MICVNDFYVVKNESSVGSDKKREISPYSPIVKFAYLGNVLSIEISNRRYQSGRFLNWGSMGKFFVFCPILL